LQRSFTRKPEKAGDLGFSDTGPDSRVQKSTAMIDQLRYG
jgi:hypothetical protein